MSNRILLTDGSSSILGANGISHILLVAGVFVSTPTNADRVITIAAESRGLLAVAESRILTIAAE